MILEGFLLCLSLIVAIGPQNAFVIRQGINKNYVFLTILIVSLCDILLISLGVLGVGQTLNRFLWLKVLLTMGGVIFLAIYGTKTFLNAFKNQSLKVDTQNKQSSAVFVALQALSFSLLNPHAILDTLVILGSVSAQYNFNNAILFGVGACLASICWFLVLGYGSKIMAKHLQKPITWKILDTAIGLICLYIAATLCLQLFKILF
jgi:L-lysine exporter family protein LysE/ArgO